jgi:hypothetical protein
MRTPDQLVQPPTYLARDLIEQGYAAIDNPTPREAYESLGLAFDQLVGEVGGDELARTTQYYVNCRRGATSGYFEKSPGQRGSGKRSFTFRIPNTLYWSGAREPAQTVKDFVAQGTEIMIASAGAIRGCIEDLEGDLSGLLEAHYSRASDLFSDGKLRQDFDMRIVQYDPATKPDQVVSNPHRDLSSFTLHGFDSSPGSFYAIREHSDGKRPRLCFPAVELGGKAVLFTGCRLRADERDPVRPWYDSRYPVVYPDFPGTPIWHGALAGEGIGDTRRTVVVSQLHPRPNIGLNVTSESYRHRDAPQPIMTALGEGLMALYSQR